VKQKGTRHDVPAPEDSFFGFPFTRHRHRFI
jgi:hypothetical protein